MTTAHALHLPTDLLKAALKVPDFQAKLEQFARTEIALHRFRKSRFQPKSLRILAKAKQAVADKTLPEKDRPAKVDEFLHLCDTMLSTSR
jgi:hypothetical protein